jgi:hypothetical protein
MNDPGDKSVVGFEMLKKLGARWAVLTAMTADMARKGIKVPHDVIEGLKTARIKIGSGCFSPCEASCELSKVEGQIFSQCHLFGDQDFKNWSDLLAEAAQGKLNYERIRGIPALDPVKSDCEFLKCICSG